MPAARPRASCDSATPSLSHLAEQQIAADLLQSLFESKRFTARIAERNNMGHDGVGLREGVMGNMGKRRKRIVRGDHYQTMAAGYQILRSPLADSYGAAAKHYRESDPPLDPPEGTDAARRSERESERD